MKDCINQCQQLYNTEISDSNNNKFDVYKAMCLNLLGLADKENISSCCQVPGFTLEDFLWCELWFIQTGRFVNKTAVSSVNGCVVVAVVFIIIIMDFCCYCFNDLSGFCFVIIIYLF